MVPYVETTLILLILFCALWTGLRALYNTRSSLPLPPGPAPWPILGNILDMPKERVPEAFASWRQKYGDIFHLHILGKNFIVLNSYRAASDLLEERGSLYSNRPHSIMGHDLLGKANAVLLHQYGEPLKRHRRLLRTALEPRRMADYVNLQLEECSRFVVNLAQSPENFARHTRRYSTGLTMGLAYGYRPQDGDKEDHFVLLAEEVAKVTFTATEPGRWPVEHIPILRYLPLWAPGAGFKRWAASARGIIQEAATKPYAWAKNRAIREGKRSFVSEIVDIVQDENGKLTTEDEQFLVWTSAAIYSGGTNANSAIGKALILYLTAFPEVQAKAQLELDKALGPDRRLPTLDDRPKLPYIEALLKEVHRFYPIAPMIPHSSRSDDSYMGYKIPKASWVIGNTWAMAHDAEVYHKPFEFCPERYLGDTPAPDPRSFTFGFGRRRCPGIAYADANFFLQTVYLLSIFNITLVHDQQGNAKVPSMAFIPGHIAFPEDFECVITVRSPKLLEHAQNYLRSLD